MKRLLSLGQHPLGADVAEVLVQNPGAAIGVVFLDGKARLFGPGCQHKSLESASAGAPPGSSYWVQAPSPEPTAPIGRTQAALRLLAQNPGMTPHAAAKQAGVHVSAVYRAQQRASRPTCPCCGQRMPT